MKIKLYIVTEAEFDKDKPRAKETVPQILITTTDKKHAVEIVKERFNDYRIMNGYEIEFEYYNGFTFCNEPYYYGHVEMHEQEIEVNTIETGCNICGKTLKFTKVTCSNCNKEDNKNHE